jgi:gamma-glutamyltranspeptidase / glutathione hydrolase
MTLESGGLVAAGNRHTAEAAASVLGEGGNAFDAVVAALWMACVCEPVLCSLGGGGFVLTQKDGAKPEIIDFFTDTPLVKLPEHVLDFELITADFGSVRQEFHTGHGSAATPGFVAGLFALHRNHGSMPMSELTQPAIRLATKGHKFDPFQAYILDIVSSIMLRSPEATRLYQSRKFNHKNEPMKEGETFKNLDLANSIERIGLDGENLFYHGELAEVIAHSQSEGGLITLDDLEAYEVKTRTPIMTKVGGANLYTNPIPSSGGTLLALQLALLASAPKDILDEATGWSLGLVEAMGTANHARRTSGFIEDPSNAAIKSLFEEHHIKDFQTALAKRAEKVGGTTHISVADANGNVASATTSNGEGCGHIIPGTGIMLNNMLGEEDINPLGFFKWECGTRISSMMAPSLLIQEGGKRTALGSGGSNRIRTALFQVAANMALKGMNEEQAIAHPRLHYEYNLLQIEQGFQLEILDDLTAAYPEHHLWQDKNLFFGGVHAASTSPFGLSGAADARRGGVVIKI